MTRFFFSRNVINIHKSVSDWELFELPLKGMNHGGESHRFQYISYHGAPVRAMSFLEPTFSTAPSRAQTWPGNHVALSENRMPSVTLNPLAPWIIWIPLNIANLVASPIFRRIFFTGTSPWHGAKLLNYCYIHEGPGELARALIAASSREQQQPFFFPRTAVTQRWSWNAAR